MLAKKILAMLRYMFYGMFRLFMAKVDGPLFSLEARGKIADAMVFFPWKGRHVVRQWLKPTNPQSTKQGYIRAALKAIGKWVKQIENLNDGDSEDSVVYQACTSSAAAGLNWNAWIAQGFLNALQSGGALVTASFTDLIEVYSSLNTTDIAAYASEASNLGMVDFAFGYGYTTNIPAGLQLFFGAHAVFSQSIIGAAPYNTDPDNWVLADITDFAEDMTSNA
jgi:hypothetical protein